MSEVDDEIVRVLAHSIPRLQPVVSTAIESGSAGWCTRIWLLFPVPVAGIARTTSINCTPAATPCWSQGNAGNMEVDTSLIYLIPN